ncbi:MAG: hypothetical protein OEV78_08765 [Spirochaetia bacterium]|nr:hypothetical protein [Spirochaetia bacterium]
MNENHSVSGRRYPEHIASIPVLKNFFDVYQASISALNVVNHKKRYPKKMKSGTCLASLTGLSFRKIFASRRVPLLWAKA